LRVGARGANPPLRRQAAATKAGYSLRAPGCRGRKDQELEVAGEVVKARQSRCPARVR